MALNARSLFLYGLEITSLNQNLDFQIASGGPVLTAQLEIGFYSATSLVQQIVTAMQDQDTSNIYFATVNRNVMGGLENRITIGSNGSYLSLLFGSGPNAPSSPASLFGFNPVDYTGATSYIGSQTAGSTLLTTYAPYSYLDDLTQGKVFGAVNVSASGLKEAVVFNLQQFLNMEFKYEPASFMPEWNALWQWLIQQRPFDFTPQITAPDTVYQVTLNKTQYDGQGLGFQMKEMLPSMPNFYQTGPLEFRIITQGAEFVSPT